MLYNLKRLTGYAFGFILFYAPVALFQRCLFYLLYGSWQPQSIHGLCFRIPIEHILDGIIWRLTPISMLSTLLLLAAAFFLGPVFAAGCARQVRSPNICRSWCRPNFKSAGIVIQKLPPSVMVCWQAFAWYLFSAVFWLAPIATSFCSIYWPTIIHEVTLFR